jgi:hypothetical protein
VHDELVDEARAEEAGGEGGAALEQDVPDPAVEEGSERGRRVAGRQVQRLAGALDGGKSGRLGGPDDDAQGLAGVEGAVGAAGGEGGAVDPGGAGADEDRVAGGAQQVHLLAGGRSGDPAARPVGRGGASVQGEGGLRGDQRPRMGQAVLPAAVQGGRGRGELGGDLRDDLDPGTAQALEAAARDRVRIAAGDHDARDPGGEQGLGAGAGAPGVVAGLEGDHGGRAVEVAGGAGEGVGLGVGGAGAAVVALGQDRAVGGEQHAADAGVRAEGHGGIRGDLEGAAQGTGLRGIDHGLSSVRCSRFRRERKRGYGVAGGARPCPEGRQVRPRTSTTCASHPDSHRRSRSSTWSAEGQRPSGRGLSPPARNFTDPSARERHQLVESPR